MPAAKATILSRLLPHLKELKKTVGKLLGDGWEVAFADVVPQDPIVRQRCCPSCQSHRECQGKDVCLGQVAVLLQREGKDVRKEHLATLSKGTNKETLSKRATNSGICTWKQAHEFSVTCLLRGINSDVQPPEHKQYINAAAMTTTFCGCLRRIWKQYSKQLSPLFIEPQDYRCRQKMNITYLPSAALVAKGFHKPLL